MKKLLIYWGIEETKNSLFILLGTFLKNKIPRIITTEVKEFITQKVIDDETNEFQSSEKPEIAFYSGGGSYDAIVDHEGSISEISKFTYKANHWEFFTRLSGYNNIGYTDITNEVGKITAGLCEYISLTSLINYFQIYNKNNYYLNNPISDFYKKFSENEIVHKKFGNGNKEAVAYKMWEKNDQWTDMKSGNGMKWALKNWLGTSYFNQHIDFDYSAAFMHSSNPEDWLIKYKIPVLLSFYVQGIGHNVLIYAYDKPTNSYAVHFGWGARTTKYSQAIIKKSTLWSFWSFGFWFAFREK